jgi:hypothetical protein
MSSDQIENTKIDNLEDNDFGDKELNNLFNNLNPVIQEKIKKYPRKEVQIEILKNINDTELISFYRNILSEKSNDIFIF